MVLYCTALHIVRNQRASATDTCLCDERSDSSKEICPSGFPPRTVISPAVPAIPWPCFDGSFLARGEHRHDR